MAKEELIEMRGKVAEILPDSRCRVILDNGHELVAYTVHPQSPVGQGQHLPRWARPALVLRAGKVVALDSTAALIRRISGSQLVVRLSGGSLPPSLAHLVSHPENAAATGQYTLRVNHHDEVEPILAALRTSGAKLEDLQLHQADLEDVFIQIMGKSS